MEKLFYYQPHIRYSEKIVSVFFIALIGFCPLLPLITGCPGPGWACPGVRLSVYMAATLALMSVLFQKICRQWRTAHITVSDTGLVVCGPWSVRSMSYKDVDRLFHVHFFFLWGCMIVRTGKKYFFLSFIIQDFAKLAGLVKEKCALQGNMLNIKQSRFENFLRYARINDIVNDNLFNNLPKLSVTTALSTIFSAFVAGYVWRVSAGYVFIWMQAGLILPPLAYITATSYCAYRIEGNMKKNRGVSSFDDTDRVFNTVIFITGLIYFAGGIFFRHFARW